MAMPKGPRYSFQSLQRRKGFTLLSLLHLFNTVIKYARRSPGTFTAHVINLKYTSLAQF